MADLALGIKLNLDTKQGESNLQRFEAAFNQVLRSLGKSPNEDGAIRKLVADAQAGKLALNDLDAATTKLMRNYASGSKVAAARDVLGLRDHAAIVRDIDAVRAAYDNLKNSGALTGRELAQANLAMRDQVRALRNETNGWTATLSRARGELATAAVAVGGVGYALAQAASQSAQFGKKMAEVSTLLDDTAGMATLTQGVRDLSRAYGGDANVNAKALYDIISAGASNTADALNTLTVANRLAIGGVTDVGTAADGLTSILNAYGLSAADATAVSDAFFVAVKAGKTTVPQLSDALGQVAPIASTAGVSLDQLLSSVAALTAGGTRTPEAITGIRAALTNIITPSSQATQLAEKLGIAFDAQALKAQGLQGFLMQVARATGGNISQMSQLFSSVEGLNAVLTLTGAGADKFSQTLAAMATKSGQTDIAVAKMMDTPAFAAAQFRAAIDDLDKSLGQAVTALTPVVNALTRALNAFNALPAPVRDTAAGVAVLAVSATALAIAVAPLLRALGTLRLAASIAANPLKTGARAISALGVEAAAATPLLRALALVRIGTPVGLALYAADLLRLKANADASYESIKRLNATQINSLRTDAEINAGGVGTAVLPAADLARQNGFEQANYADNLRQAQAYYAAKVEAAQRGDASISAAEAAANLAQKHVYDQALADLKQYQAERGTAEAAFNGRLSTIKAQQTAIIEQALADQLRKYQAANAALKKLQDERAAIEASFNQTGDALNKPKNAPAPDIVAVQGAVQKAQGLQQDGDLKGAATAAEQARQLIEAANAAGSVSDYFLKDYLARAKQVALDANQGQQEAAQKEISGYQASIDALKGAAEFLKSLPIGFDVAGAEQSAAELQAKVQALLTQNPLVIPVVLKKPDAADTQAGEILKGDSAPSGNNTPGFASGGYIAGAGTGTSDSILARLSNGEFVVRAAAVRNYGADFLHRINRMRLPKFAGGGLIGRLAIPTAPAQSSGGMGGSMATSGDTIYLNLAGGQPVGPLRAEAPVVDALKRAALMFGSAR